jgi:hypothetical protein
MQRGGRERETKMLTCVAGARAEEVAAAAQGLYPATMTGTVARHLAARKELGDGQAETAARLNGGK